MLQMDAPGVRGFAIDHGKQRETPAVPRRGGDDLSGRLRAKVSVGIDTIAGAEGRRVLDQRELHPAFELAPVLESRDHLLPGITALGEAHSSQRIQVQHLG